MHMVQAWDWPRSAGGRPDATHEKKCFSRKRYHDYSATQLHMQIIPARCTCGRALEWHKYAWAQRVPHSTSNEAFLGLPTCCTETLGNYIAHSKYCAHRAHYANCEAH